MNVKYYSGLLAISALLAASAALAQPPLNPQRSDNGNRLNNPFRTQFKPAWTMSIQDPVKLVDVGAVTDPKRTNLVLLVAGKNPTDTQRKLRVLHWNGSSYILDTELVSQSIGIDTLLLGKFSPGAPAPTIVPSKTVGTTSKPQKRRDTGPSKGMQILTNTGIYSWYSNSLQPVFARQLPDVKQAIVLENRTDMVVVGAGD